MGQVTEPQGASFRGKSPLELHQGEESLSGVWEAVQGQRTGTCQEIPGRIRFFSSSSVFRRRKYPPKLMPGLARGAGLRCCSQSLR